MALYEIIQLLGTQNPDKDAEGLFRIKLINLADVCKKARRAERERCARYIEQRWPEAAKQIREL